MCARVSIEEVKLYTHPCGLQNLHESARVHGGPARRGDGVRQYACAVSESVCDRGGIGVHELKLLIIEIKKSYRQAYG